jgi:hypothetical protein
MDQNNVENRKQETEAGLPVMPNPGATQVLSAVEGHAIFPWLTPEPPHASTANPHLLSDADVQLFQQGTHCRLQEMLNAHPVTLKGVWPATAGDSAPAHRRLE